MPTAPRPPIEAPIEDTPSHSGDFTGAIHLIREDYPISLNNRALPANVEIDTSFNRAEILAAHEPIPMAMPALLGLRKVLAKRRVESANQRLPELERHRRVAHFVGKALLLNHSYTHHYNKDGSPNIYRPVSRKELKTARRLDEINNMRRRHQAYHYSLARPFAENGFRDYRATEHINDISRLDMPPNPTKAEAKHARKSQKRYGQSSRAIRQFDKDFRSEISKPSEKAEHVIRKRERNVVTVEAIERRQEANRIAREALKAKAAAKARAGWSGTKTVTKTVGHKTRSGVVTMGAGTKRVVKKAPRKVKKIAGTGLNKLRKK